MVLVPLLKFPFLSNTCLITSSSHSELYCKVSTRWQQIMMHGGHGGAMKKTLHTNTVCNKVTHFWELIICSCYFKLLWLEQKLVDTLRIWHFVKIFLEPSHHHLLYCVEMFLLCIPMRDNDDPEQRTQKSREYFVSSWIIQNSDSTCSMEERHTVSNQITVCLHRFRTCLICIWFKQV